MSLNKLKASYCWSLSFSWVVAPKEAVCISKVHSCFLFSKSSFKRLIFTLLKQVNTYLQGISIPPQNCLHDACGQSLQHMSFRHVRENTKIFASTFKAWLLSARAYPFNCLRTSWSIIQCDAIMLKKITSREHLNFFEVNKIKVWQVKFRYLKSSLIWKLIKTTVCQCFETALVCTSLPTNRASLELQSLLSQFFIFFKIWASKLGGSLYMDFYSTHFSNWFNLTQKNGKFYPLKEKTYNFIEVFLVKDKFKRHLINRCWKKHLAWRLMILADKWSQFTATHSENNINSMVHNLYYWR